MSDLVTGSDIIRYLGLADDDPGLSLALSLGPQVEALLLSLCGREGRPWQRSKLARVERRDGTGRPILFLDYPVKLLTTVKLGHNLTVPDETLVVNDQTVLVWDVGSPKLERVDGGKFGAYGVPGYVTVTYDTGEDAPAQAGLAVLSGIAMLWGQRGSEGVQSESLDGVYSSSMFADMLKQNPVWQSVVDSCRGGVFT